MLIAVGLLTATGALEWRLRAGFSISCLRCTRFVWRRIVGRGEAEGERLLDDAPPEKLLGLLEAVTDGVVGVDIPQHVTHLAHEVDRLVEGQDQISLGDLDRLTDLRHAAAAAPGTGRAVEGLVVPLGDVEAVVMLLAEDVTLQVLQAAAEQDELVR